LFVFVGTFQQQCTCKTLIHFLLQGTAMRALLSARLQALALDADTAPSAAGNILASWLLVWLLSALNRAAAKAAVDPVNESASYNAAAIAVCRCIGVFQQLLQQRDVEDLLRQRGWPDLMAHATHVYRDARGQMRSALNRAPPRKCLLLSRSSQS
jgi:hypothetical protein